VSRWDTWKERNAWWWNFATAPLIVLFLVALFAYKLYVGCCIVFGWKPWRLP
jgi:hypothetical protein